MNTHNYKLAKFLVPLLQPLCTSDLIVSDAFEFANFIRQQHYNSITRLASVDVESLFTNVPTTKKRLAELLQADEYQIKYSRCVHILSIKMSPMKTSWKII